jgi:hypothetical protein
MTATTILLVINILASMFAAPLGVDSIGNVVTNALFKEDSINTATPEINQNLDEGIQREVNAAGTLEGALSFVDGLKAIFSFIINLLFIGFALAVMLYQTGAPIYVVWLIGLPAAAGFYIGIVSFIRGFSG